MKFTYNGYRGLLCQLREQGYAISDYHDYSCSKKVAILRHDVDNDLKKALRFAELEAEEGVKSTYFVLVTSDFYNLMSKESEQTLKKIIKYGHEIGLHFDEVRYGLSEDTWDEAHIAKLIINESKLLEKICEEKVTTVSMHRPSKKTLNSNLHIPGMINSYGFEFFEQFKYVSDSRMHWREDVEEIINSGNFDKIHILTHAFWYFEEEKDIKSILVDYVQNAKYERYNQLKNDITDLTSVLKKEEL